MIGVTAMFMATKIDEIYPLKLKTVYEKIGHRKLTIESIKQKESEFLEVFNFNVVGFSLYESLMLCLHTLNQCNFDIYLEIQLTPKMMSHMEQLCVYLLKAVTYDYPIMSSYSNTAIICSTVLIGFKMFEQLYKEFSAEDKVIDYLFRSK
jgi:hypothetical protein